MQSTSAALKHTAKEHLPFSGNSTAGLHASELLRLFVQTPEAMEHNPEVASEIALGFFRRIASFDAAAAVRASGGLVPWQKRKVERYLTLNLGHNICLVALAREVKPSVSHFCRAFKKSFGDTPHAYIVHLRLELAQNLMLTTDDPLSQFALSCGFADQAHLSKLFRRVLHEPPNAWRRRNLTKAQEGSGAAETALRVAA